MLYIVLDMDGNEFVCMSGQRLVQEGFSVTIDEVYGGRLYEEQNGIRC